MPSKTICKVAASMGAIAWLGTSVAAVAHARTYYVRTDGGTAAHCNGTADAPAKAAPNCAWNSPLEALPPSLPNYPHPARIKGGDTLVIGPGAYKIGWSAGVYDANHYGDSCAIIYASYCTMQKVPGGTIDHPTRIVGAGWDTGCKAPPELYGVQGIAQIFNLDGADNVELGCLDLTDHSNCTVGYAPNPSYSCTTRGRSGGTTAPELGLWADKAIHAQDSHNVTLLDLDIHGFADMGVQAGRIRDWRVTRVRITGNGNAGWNGDLGGNNHNSTNSGTLTFTDLTIAWNGCAENYPDLGSYINCWGQNEGGYGDGFSEAWTGGDFVFIRPLVYKNTQDGLDLLYANGSGSITVDRGYFAQNAGNDLKTSGNATITNSVFIGQCTWFRTAGYPAGADSCRAGGGQLADFTAPDQRVIYAYNTLTGEGDCLLSGDSTFNNTSSNVSSSDVYDIYNNIFVGQASSLPRNDGAPTCFTYFGDTIHATVSYASNLVWRTRDTSCHSAGVQCVNPGLRNTTLQGFDPTPLAGSPARGAASPLPQRGSATGVTHGRNIGAVQDGAGPPKPRR